MLLSNGPKLLERAEPQMVVLSDFSEPSPTIKVKASYL
jgi:hypothetical protein